MCAFLRVRTGIVQYIIGPPSCSVSSLQYYGNASFPSWNRFPPGRWLLTSIEAIHFWADSHDYPPSREPTAPRYCEGPSTIKAPWWLTLSLFSWVWSNQVRNYIYWMESVPYTKGLPQGSESGPWEQSAKQLGPQTANKRTCTPDYQKENLNSWLPTREPEFLTTNKRTCTSDYQQENLHPRLPTRVPEFQTTNKRTWIPPTVQMSLEEDFF